MYITRKNQSPVDFNAISFGTMLSNRAVELTLKANRLCFRDIKPGNILDIFEYDNTPLARDVTDYESLIKAAKMSVYSEELVPKVQATYEILYSFITLQYGRFDLQKITQLKTVLDSIGFEKYTLQALSAFATFYKERNFLLCSAFCQIAANHIKALEPMNLMLDQEVGGIKHGDLQMKEKLLKIVEIANSKPNC